MSFIFSGKDHSTELIKSVQSGDRSQVIKLLQKGSANTRDITGRSALSIAISLGKTDVAYELIRAGALKNAVDADGRAPIHVAATLGHLECVTLLCNFAADLESPEGGTGCTPIELALYYGHAKCAEQLYRRGAQLRGVPVMGLDWPVMASFVLTDDCRDLVDRIKTNAVQREPLEERLFTQQEEAERERRARRAQIAAVVSQDFEDDCLDDDYRLDIDERELTVGAEIGSGTFATVHRGVYRREGDRHGREVAIKIFRETQNFSAEAIEEESKTLFQYRHKHIAALIGNGFIDGKPCLVMPLYRKSLRAWLDDRYLGPESRGAGGAGLYNRMARLAREDAAHHRGGQKGGHQQEHGQSQNRAQRGARQPLTLVQYGSIAGGIASAMEHLHAKGVCHRDLKPDNVLLDAELNPYIADMGQASASRLMTTSRAVGTPLYSAPEVTLDMGGAPYNAALADIFSYGAMLYHMYTLKVPAFNPDGTISFPLLSTNAFDASPGIRALVAACTERDPARRPQSFSEVRALLRDALIPREWQTYLASCGWDVDRQLLPENLERFDTLAALTRTNPDGIDEYLRRMVEEASRERQRRQEQEIASASTRAPARGGGAGGTGAGGGGGGGGGGGSGAGATGAAAGKGSVIDVDGIALLEECPILKLGRPLRTKTSFFPRLFSLNIPLLPSGDLEVAIIAQGLTGGISMACKYKRKPGGFYSSYDGYATAKGKDTLEIVLSSRSKPPVQAGMWYFAVYTPWGLLSGSVEFSIFFEIRAQGGRVIMDPAASRAHTELFSGIATRAAPTTPSAATQAQRASPAPADLGDLDVPVTTLQDFVQGGSLVPPPPPPVVAAGGAPRSASATILPPPPGHQAPHVPPPPASADYTRVGDDVSLSRLPPPPGSGGAPVNLQLPGGSSLPPPPAAVQAIPSHAPPRAAPPAPPAAPPAPPAAPPAPPAAPPAPASANIGGGGGGPAPPPPPPPGPAAESPVGRKASFLDEIRAPKAPLRAVLQQARMGDAPPPPPPKQPVDGVFAALMDGMMKRRVATAEDDDDDNSDGSSEQDWRD